LFGGRFRFLYSTGVFPSGTFPLSEGPTGHRLPNPVGPRIPRFRTHATIIKSAASSGAAILGAAPCGGFRFPHSPHSILSVRRLYHAGL
jgi:hypothetical protein